jgi:DNA-binding NtrC family response regulator
VIIVDDEPDMLENCERVLTADGYRCLTFTSGSEALRAVVKEKPDLMFTDLRMPEMDGLTLLRLVKESGHTMPVIFLTAYAAVETAVAAIREGAYDYLTKPFSNDQLRAAVERALRERRLEEENRRLKAELQKLVGLERFIGFSPQMQELFALVRKVAPTEANVLVQGESGTGKELMARCVHLNSRRAGGPFIPLDCASLPEHLLEAELFGHEKGAYTDAHRAKMGLIEAAEGGTLFLDEIGDMPLGLQAKLLRVIQERQIRRLGSNTMVEVNIRIVSATHRPLETLVAERKFREDLYYRLNVISLTLPPLRQRSGDVVVLAKHFLKAFSASNSRDLRGFDAAAVRLLEAHAWPGNVRELQNVVERAVAVTDGPTVTPADLPESVRRGGERLPAAAG